MEARENLKKFAARPVRPAARVKPATDFAKAAASMLHMAKPAASFSSPIAGVDLPR